MNSIKWLMEQLTINGSGAVKTFPELFEKAEEIRKKEIIDAATWGTLHQTPEQYYNEKFKTTKDGFVYLTDAPLMFNRKQKNDIKKD